MKFDEQLQNEVAEALSPIVEKYPQLLAMTAVYTWRPEYALDLSKGITLLQKSTVYNLNAAMRVQQKLGTYRDNYITGFIQSITQKEKDENKQPEEPAGQTEGT